MVILVEDDEGETNAIRDYVTHGYAFRESENALEALDNVKAMNGAPFVVVMDTIVQHLTAKELMKEVQAVNPNAGFIVITEHPEVHKFTGDRNVQAVLKKPVDPDELIPVLASAY